MYQKTCTILVLIHGEDDMSKKGVEIVCKIAKSQKLSKNPVPPHRIRQKKWLIN